MNNSNRVRFPSFIVNTLVFTLLFAFATTSIAQAATSSKSYADLLVLFEDWRQFEQPPLLEGAPDYTNGVFYELEVVVTEAVVTTPPVILTQLPVGTVNVSDGTLQAYSITYSEADNDTVSFQWLVDSVDQSTNASSFNLDTTGFGEATTTIEVFVIDNDGNDTASWTLETYVPSNDYVGTYEADDLDDIVVDGVGKLLFVGVVMASVIAILLLYL